MERRSLRIEPALSRSPSGERAPSPKDKQLPDSAGVESSGWGSDLRPRWDDPWSRSLGISQQLISREFPFWITLALIGGIGSSLPWFGLLFWPFTTVLVVGAVSDSLAGERHLTVPGVLGRWAGRILPAIVTMISSSLVVALLGGLYLLGGRILWSFVHHGFVVHSRLGSLLLLAVCGTGLACFISQAFRISVFPLHASVLTRTWGPSAIRRSLELSEGKTLPLLGAALGIGLVTTLVGGLFLVPLGLVSAALGEALTGSGRGILEIAVLGVLANSPVAVANQLVVNWGTAAWTCLFFREQRQSLPPA